MKRNNYLESHEDGVFSDTSRLLSIGPVYYYVCVCT